MTCVGVTAASPGVPVRTALAPSSPTKLWTNNRPPSSSTTSVFNFRPSEWSWAPPVAGNRSSILISLVIYHIPSTRAHTTRTTPPNTFANPIPHTILVEQRFTNSQWSHLNIYEDKSVMLVIGGVERTPGPATTQYLNIAHININSITAGHKIDELLQFVQINDIKICALTETKLDNTISSTLYKLHNFHDPFTRHWNRNGGGVALYTHSSLPIKRLHELELDDEEWIWAKIKTQKLNLLVCCVYLPPNLSSHRVQLFIDRFSESISLAQTHSPDAILLLGVFNTGNVYLDQDIYNHSGITPFDHKLKNTAQILDLSQLIKHPPRITDNISNLRDLIFTSNTDIIIDSGTLSAFSTLDHLPIFASVLGEPPPCNTNVTHQTIWDYSRLDSQLLTRLLLNTDWDQILDNDVHTATDQFVSAILLAVEASIPKKKVRANKCKKPWMTAELLKHIRKRDKIFRHAKQTQKTYDWDRWKYERNIVTAMNKRLKQ